MASALYQQLILEHGRTPRNFGPLPTATHRAGRDNPFCGDHLTVSVRLASDRLAEIRFEGEACAVAMASASMMTVHLAGKTRAEAQTLATQFSALVSSGVIDEQLGELCAFAAVSQFPVRVQCARLPWIALRAALALPEV
jgi:nitrogen fixation NifU-like protein